MGNHEITMAETKTAAVIPKGYPIMMMSLNLTLCLFRSKSQEDNNRLFDNAAERKSFFKEFGHFNDDLIQLFQNIQTNVKDTTHNSIVQDLDSRIKKFSSENCDSFDYENHKPVSSLSEKL